MIEFNKEILLNNIQYLVNEQNKKVGELEAEAGVSVGYIARNKDSNSIPNIEFVMKVADILKVSIDCITKYDLKSLTATERYILNFLDKLTDDTEQDKLFWNKNNKDYYNSFITDANGQFFEHPLFNLEEFSEPGETEYPVPVKRIVFNSNTFGLHTYINGDCFELRLKNNVKVYLMNISKNVRKPNENCSAIEIWVDKNYLCSNKEGTPLATNVDALYQTVAENSKHPKIDMKIQYSIDAYMNDDLEDDLIDDTLF